MTTDIDAADRAVLERLAAANDSATASDVRAASGTDASSEAAAERRLSRLAENGLVSETSDGYELTPSGRRLLGTDADHSASRPDVPRDVERAMDAADLRPDVEDALARAVAFLRNWGSATANEIVDAAYSEADADYDDGEEWWDELVRERFASLPGVVPPASEGGEWRYDADGATSGSDAGDERDANHGGTDGRRVLDADGDRHGSARRALEDVARDEAERRAFSAAFEALADGDGATADELARTASEATDSSVDADRLAEVLASVPGARRDGEQWWYEGDERYWEDETGEDSADRETTEE